MKIKSKEAVTQFVTVELKVNLTKERLFSVSWLHREYHNKVVVKVHSYLSTSLFLNYLPKLIRMTQYLFTIYIGKPVGPRSGQKVRKIQDW